jgi:hypothetical protein
MPHPAVRPFHDEVPDEALADPRGRIAAIHWPDREIVADRSEGARLAGRVRQQTPKFAQIYASRAGIVGTCSHSARAFGLRHARYRGYRMPHLQQVATATALVFARLSAWFNNIPPAATRRPRFALRAPAS